MGIQLRIGAEARKLAGQVTAPVHRAWCGRPGSEARRMLGKIGFWIAQPGLDAACRRQLVALQRSRRAAADAAIACKKLELQIAELVQQPARPEHSGRGATGEGQVSAAGRVGELYRQHAHLKTEQERAAEVSHQLMAAINEFRTGMEATKAAYTAAEATAKAVRRKVGGSTSPLTTR